MSRIQLKSSSYRSQASAFKNLSNSLAPQKNGSSSGGIEREDSNFVEIGRKGGEARAQQLGHEGYVEMGRKGGEARAQQLGREGYEKSQKLEQRYDKNSDAMTSFPKRKER